MSTVSAESSGVNSPAGQALCLALIERYSALEASLSNHRVRWDECARFADPRRRDGILHHFSPGQELTNGLYDTTAKDAANVLAAGLDSSLTPMGEKWFEFEPFEKGAGLNESISDGNGLKLWFSQAADTLATVLASTNFSSVAYNLYSDLAVFGTGCMFVDELPQDASSPLKFTSGVVGQYVFEEGYSGRPNTLYRKLKMTARQMAEAFGAGNLHGNVRNCLDAKLTGASGRVREFEVLHAVFERKEGLDGEPVSKGVLTTPERRPWASIFLDLDHKCILEDGGTYEQPFVVCRLFRANNELFGRSPTDSALPDIFFRNELRRASLVSFHKSLNPSWLIPDDYPYVLDNRPGGKIFYEFQKGPMSVSRLPEPERAYAVDALMESLKQNIRRWYFADMFELFTGDGEIRRQKTAEEVRLMNKEKLARFAPLFTRISFEFLDPLLERVFSVCFRRGLFGEPPAVAGNLLLDYRIIYKSRLALALRSVQSAALLDSVMAVQSFAQFDPSVSLVFNWREGLRDFALNAGVRSKLLRPDNEIDEILEAQARQAQMAQALEAMKEGTAAVKNLGPQAQAQMAQDLADRGALSGGSGNPLEPTFDQ